MCSMPWLPLPSASNWIWPSKISQEVSVASFEGVDRTDARNCGCGERLVIDDYAHHPTEVRATLEAAAGALAGPTNRGCLPAPSVFTHPSVRNAGVRTGSCFSMPMSWSCMDIYPALARHQSRASREFGCRCCAGGWPPSRPHTSPRKTPGRHGGMD
jgi:hypothetical protein